MNKSSKSKKKLKLSCSRHYGARQAKQYEDLLTLYQNNADNDYLLYEISNVVKNRLYQSFGQQHSNGSVYYFQNC